MDIMKYTLRACASLHDMICVSAPTRVAQSVLDTLFHRAVRGI
jgi:hypothetical protein